MKGNFYANSFLIFSGGLFLLKAVKEQKDIIKIRTIEFFISDFFDL
jgi:hypothetical protein